MPDYNAEIAFDTRDVYAHPNAKAHRQIDLFASVVQKGVLVDGCTIEYSEYERNPQLLMLRIRIKAPTVSPRLMRE